MTYILLALSILFIAGLVKQHCIILDYKDAVGRAHADLVSVVKTQNATKKDVLAVIADLKKWI